MKQKIVIKVQMSSEKCRSKAMKIAATADGVSSVAVQGSDNDQLVVNGEGVDSANLTRSLRKKLYPATLLSVEEVKEKPETEQIHGDTFSASFSNNFSQFPAYYQTYQPYQPFPKYYETVDDPCQINCSIM